MGNALAILQDKYPGAFSWSFGDKAELADELAELVIKGIKTASCCSFDSYSKETTPPVVGSYSIILNSAGEPACVIRTVAMRLVRYCDVTASQARLEGEGDLSLDHWRAGHQQFFQRAGTFSEDMELVFEEFQLIEIV